jgi:hypothetical protein
VQEYLCQFGQPIQHKFAVDEIDFPEHKIEWFALYDYIIVFM